MTSVDEQAYLEHFEHFLIEEAGPNAGAMDRDGDVLRAGFEGFKREQGHLVQMPAKYGGRPLSPPAFAIFRMLLARYAGALSFLQAQHQVAVSWLARAPDHASSQQAFHAILNSGLAMGIGFLSPRHQAFEIRRTEDGYVLSGEIPWVTGFGFLEQVVTSFEHEGERHFCVLPFRSSVSGGGRLTYSDPVRLVVFDSLNTVRANLHEWPVVRDDVFLSLSGAAMAARERHNSVYTFAGGCQALRDLVGQLDQIPEGMALERDRLTERLNAYVEAIMVEGGSPSLLRAEGARLGQGWSALARWAYGGKSLLRDHPVNRLAREIWQYGVTAPRPDDLEAFYPSNPQ